MMPFNQHNNNQQPPGAPLPQQFVGGTPANMLPNLMQMQSQLGYINPQLPLPFNNLQNSHMGSSQQFMGFPANPQFPNLMGPPNPTQFFGQNNNINPMNNGQFMLQNQLQQLSNSPLLNLNPAQVNALTQLLGAANQLQAMNQQSCMFNSNPQLGFGQPNAVGLQQSNPVQQMPVGSQQIPMGSQQIPMGSQQLQNVSVPPFDLASSPHLQGQPSNFQGNHGQKPGLHSSHHQNKNFMKNSNGRFQKSHDRNLGNPKGKGKSFNISEGKGIKDGADNSPNQSKTGKRRSLAMLYTTEEVKQWCEERRKNHPFSGNANKKLAQKQASANDAVEAAMLRRQQLKDVLAKQAELGFEVPEIPSHYLSDPDPKKDGKDKFKTPSNEGRFQKNGRFQKRFGRGGKFDRRDRFASKKGTEDDGSSKKHERYAKRSRMENDDSSKAPVSIREPTLLKKLLSTDIKRDNNRLLQAFHFMVINSFFKDYPAKPLVFPKVIIKDTGVDSDAIEEKSSSFVEELGNLNEDRDISDDGDGENDDPQEEGEITD